MNFINNLYRDVEAGFITIWTLPDKVTKYFEVSNIEAAQEYAKNKSKFSDVYFGVALRKERLKKGRGSAADVCCLTAVFVDIDVSNEEAHKKCDLPKTSEEAVAFLNHDIPLPPSCIISSGHGLHAYWFLDEPFNITNDSDRETAQALLDGWNRYVNFRAKSLGWTFDSVGELARVLRVPGTQNHKCQPVQSVQEVERYPERVYSASVFEDYISSEEDSLSASDRELLANHKQYGKRFTTPEAIPDGERNNTLFKLAARLRARGLDESQIYAVLEKENSERCQPPIPLGEVKAIATSAARYPMGTANEAVALKAEEELKPIAENAAVEELLSQATFDTLFSIPNHLKRHMMFTTLMIRARTLKVARAFEQTYKARQALEDQEAKMRNEVERAAQGVDLVLPDLPVKGLVLPDQWEIDVNGVRRVKMVRGEAVIEKACSHPIIVTEHLMNIDSGQIKARIYFYRAGEWRTKIRPRSVLASRNGIVALADEGVNVHSENAKHLIQFLSDFEEANSDVLTEKKSIGRLGWVGREMFVPHNTDIDFDGEDQFRDMFNAIKSHGDRTKWLEAANKARQDFRGLIILAASFAAPLVYLTGTNIFLLHLWGSTGTGKTVALMLAQSIWGDPRKLMKTFNSTAVGLERVAAFFHSIPLALDELQTVKDKQTASQLLYKLTEGKGKARGTREGGVEAETTWANCIITNGEQPLTDDTSEGGAKNRSIEVYIKDVLFGGDLVDICDVICENNGSAGIDFISGITALNQREPGAVKATNRAYRKELGDYEAEMEDGKRHTDKQLNALALMTTALRYANEYVFGMDTRSAEDGAKEFLWQMLTLIKVTSGIDQVAFGRELVADWIAANDAQYNPETAHGVQHGVKSDDGETIYVIKSVLDAELRRNNLSPIKMTQGWKERGWLGKTDERHCTARRRINGASVRCYPFILNVDETTNGDGDFISLTGDEDMPEEWRKKTEQTELPY